MAVSLAMAVAADVSFKKASPGTNKLTIRKSGGDLWSGRSISGNLKDEPLAFFEINFSSGDNKVKLKKLKLSMSASSKDTLNSLANLKLYKLTYENGTGVAQKSLLKTVDKPTIASSATYVIYKGLDVAIAKGSTVYFRIDGDVNSITNDELTFKILNDSDTLIENNSDKDKSKISINVSDAQLSIITATPITNQKEAKISVTAPTANQKITKGSTAQVKWSASDIATTFGMDAVVYRRDESTIGAKKISIDTAADVVAFNTKNTGKIDWAVPTTLSNSTKYFVKISCSDDSGVTGPGGGCSGAGPICVNGKDCKLQPGCTGYQDYGDGQWYCTPQYRCSDFDNDPIDCSTMSGCSTQSEQKVCVPGVSGFFEIK